MAQEGQEELLSLLLDYEKQHGEKGGWLLIALGLVYLGRLVRLIETRAAILPVAPAPKSQAGPGGGLGDLLGLLGPLMGSLKPPAPAGSPGAGQGVPPAPESAAPSGNPPPEEPRKNHEVIKWDPRLVGGGRK
ncbi:MAG: hypothetical protein M0Z41_02685 [Peptococcaceae bacterium]|nr:hypothetical protein [Peptococcaceae bacterium]